MLTVAEKHKLLVSKKARPGDLILMTKQCAISSTAILAMSFPETVKSRCGLEVYHNACDLFYKTTSLSEALVVSQFNKESIVVSAMHDVTEGGVLGAAYELAVASGNGILIDVGKIPIGIPQQEICRVFSLDPKHCIGAGSMLMTIKSGYENKIIDKLAEANIACAVIGEVLDITKGLNIRDLNGELHPLLYHQKDPYWRAFFHAVKNNWK